MPAPSRQLVLIGCLALLGTTSAWLLRAGSAERLRHAGFWFEPIAYDSSLLGGRLGSQDLETIESIALAEITRAFGGLRIEFSDRRDVGYSVRVVEGLRDPRFRTPIEIAGESRAISGFGGHGSISFRLLAGHAIGCSPPTADRGTIVAAIGRGVGRSAVHEFAHQLLPTTPIHASDIRSYEYGSASRCEQYYGDMHWDRAWPLLQRVLRDRRMPG